MRQYTFSPGVPDGGLNNCDDDTLITNKQLSDCQNVIFDENQFVQKRPSIIVYPEGGGNESRTHSAKMGKNYYTFQKKDGSVFEVVFTTIKVEGSDVGVVLYSTNNTVWTNVYVGFNANYQLQFSTFADKLIMTNGFDDVVYWAGPGNDALKIGQVNLYQSAGGAATSGVHYFKVTYDAMINGATVTCSYEVPKSINLTAGNGTVTISNIPLPPDMASLPNRRIWITKADNTVLYYDSKITLTNSQTTATFAIADTSLSTSYPISVLSVQVPKGRFPEVYDNRLFLANTTDGPSECYWSEVSDFENFLPFSVLATTQTTIRANETLNDGEYCSALKTFKGMNQLLLFKKTGLYVVYPVSDRYDFRSVSPQGCTLDGSVQEFHIEDEHSSRDSIIYANESAIWEYTGHTVHEISRQPNGSSITATFKQIKQRFVEYKKNIKTTTSDFSAATIPTTTQAGNPNYVEAGVGQMTLENQFTWKASGILVNGRAFCWHPVLKRLYVTAPYMTSTSQGAFLYYTWNSVTKSWYCDYTTMVLQGTVTNTGLVTMGVTHLGETISMKYDDTTGRIIGMGKTATGGVHIWKTDNPITQALTVDGARKDISIGTEGKTEKPNWKLAYVPYSTGNSRVFVFTGNLKLRQQKGGATYQSSGEPSSGTQSYVDTTKINKYNYFYVSEYCEVFNAGIQKTYFLNDTFIDGPILNDPNPVPYTYVIEANSSQMLKPGLYCVFNVLFNTIPEIPNVYCKRPINYAMETLAGKAYITGIATTGYGSAQLSEKTIYKIDISAWTAPVSYIAAGHGYVFMGKSANALYVSGTSLIGNSILACGNVWKITGTGTTAPTMPISSTSLFLKGFAVSSSKIFGYEYRLSENDFNLVTIDTATMMTRTSGRGVVSVDLGPNKNLSFYANTEKDLFYFVNNDGNVYEYSTNVLSLGQSAAFSAFKSIDTSVMTFTNTGTGTTTAGRHRVKMTFTYGGKNYILKDTMAYISDGHYCLISYIPLDSGSTQGYTNRSLWVAKADDIEEIYYQVRGTTLADIATTATIDRTDGNLWATTLDETKFLQCQSFYDIIPISNIALGVPSMLMTGTGASSPATRGILGNYAIYGEFLFTGASSFDTGSEHFKLLTMEIDQTGAIDSIQYYMHITYNIPTMDHAWCGGSVLPGVLLEGKQYTDPGHNTLVLSLGANLRYIHQLIAMKYDVQSLCLNSQETTWQATTLNSVVVNYITVKGGSTVPLTNVTSAVLGKYYYLAVTIPNASTLSPYENKINNMILVLDRQKRWTKWTSAGIHPAAFTVSNGVLKWTDALIDANGESDFIYSLADRENNTFADLVINTADASVATPAAIDAWYITKNFRKLAEWDSSMFKKHIRRIFATALRGISITPYTLTIGVNFDERKEDDGTGTIVDAWTERTIDLTAADSGKLIKNVNFSAGTSGHRVRYRFRNNQLYKDLSMIDYEVEGFILHRRPV